MMRNALKFYIDGRWVDPCSDTRLPVINPATEQTFGEIAMGNLDDVEAAVNAARRAFPSFAETSPAQRTQLLQRILAAFMDRYDEIADAILTRNLGPAGPAVSDPALPRATGASGGAHERG